MTEWRLKAIVQRFCATVPMGQHLYRFLQATLGGLRSQRPEAYVEVCGRIVDAMGGTHRFAGSEGVEVGTGWNVSLPLALHLCGASTCVTFDATRHCYPREALRSARALVPVLREALDGDVRERIDSRWAELAQLEWDRFLEAAGVDYRAPADVGDTGLPAASYDLVFSRAVLQHIPPDALSSIFSEAARILKPGGRMWHWLDLTDQRRMFDRRLTRIDNLRYSQQEWDRIAANLYSYSNRWRVSEYVRLAEDTGFEVEVRNTRLDEESVAFVRAGGVHPDFANRDEEDLATVVADLVCRKP